MTTLFISDLHLSDERPQIIQLFQEFLQQQAHHCEALYILGDLFEIWLGDDIVPPDIQPVLDSLTTLTGAGVPVYLMTGNRDFLLGDAFAGTTGIRIITDPTIVDLYGTPTLLMHGDTLCTDDQDYQDFRKLVRSEAWQQQFLAQSVEQRLAFGKSARKESSERTRQKPEYITDVNAQAVQAAFAEHQVQHIIHGHTHRPAIHRLTSGDARLTRIVLGDWYDQSSVLKVDQDGFQLTDHPHGRW